MWSRVKQDHLSRFAVLCSMSQLLGGNSPYKAHHWIFIQYINIVIHLDRHYNFRFFKLGAGLNWDGNSMDGFPIEMSVGTADVFVSKKTVKLTEALMNVHILSSFFTVFTFSKSGLDV